MRCDSNYERDSQKKASMLCGNIWEYNDIVLQGLGGGGILRGMAEKAGIASWPNLNGSTHSRKLVAHIGSSNCYSMKGLEVKVACTSKQ